MGLGEAYTNSGRFTAALKVFTQARKLNSEDWFAKYMLANVHKDLGDYDEATSGYQEVLKIRGNEFGVLIALCETLVSAAFHFIVKGYSKDATDFASQVFDVAILVAEERPDAFNMWKAVGDACLALSWTKLNGGEFPVATVKRLLDMNIDRKEFDIMAEVDDITGSTLDQLADIETGSRPIFAAILTFKRGIYTSADDRHAHAVAWFNLGVAEHRAYVSEPGRETRYRQAAIHCFKRAIKLEPGNCDFWNALGVVTSEVSARVAQHALVRSLYINDKVSVPYSERVSLTSIRMSTPGLISAVSISCRKIMTSPERPSRGPNPSTLTTHKPGSVKVSLFSSGIPSLPSLVKSWNYSSTRSGFLTITLSLFTANSPTPVSTSF